MSFLHIGAKIGGWVHYILSVGNTLNTRHKGEIMQKLLVLQKVYGTGDTITLELSNIYGGSIVKKAIKKDIINSDYSIFDYCNDYNIDTSIYNDLSSEDDATTDTLDNTRSINYYLGHFTYVLDAKESESDINNKKSYTYNTFKAVWIPYNDNMAENYISQADFELYKRAEISTYLYNLRQYIASYRRQVDILPECISDIYNAGIFGREIDRLKIHYCNKPNTDTIIKLLRKYNNKTKEVKAV